MGAQTTADKKLAVWRIVEEGFNQGRTEVVAEVCADGFLDATSIFTVPRGPAGLVHHMRNARERIPGFALRLVGLVGDGDLVSVCWQTEGSAGGYFGSPQVRTTSAWLVAFFSFVNGRIVLKEDNFESLRLLVQGGGLDVVPAAPAGLAAARFDGIADLLTPRREQFHGYPSRDEAVAVRVPNPQRRRELEAFVVGYLRHGYGLGEAPAGALAIGADAHLSWADMADGRGAAGWAEHRDMNLGAFKGASFDVRRFVVEEDAVAVRYEVGLVHRGRYLGLEPTGRAVSVTGALYAAFDGPTLTTWIEVVDVVSVLRELGGLASVLPGCLPSQ